VTLFYPIMYTFVRVIYQTAGQTVQGAMTSSARLIAAAVLLPLYLICARARRVRTRPVHTDPSRLWPTQLSPCTRACPSITTLRT
jgi:hypothetical protein